MMNAMYVKTITAPSILNFITISDLPRHGPVSKLVYPAFLLPDPEILGHRVSIIEQRAGFSGSAKR